MSLHIRNKELVALPTAVLKFPIFFFPIANELQSYEYLLLWNNIWWQISRTGPLHILVSMGSL